VACHCGKRWVGVLGLRSSQYSHKCSSQLAFYAYHSTVLGGWDGNGKVCLATCP
jgi:hypothetical protein